MIHIDADDNPRLSPAALLYAQCVTPTREHIEWLLPLHFAWRRMVEASPVEQTAEVA